MTVIAFRSALRAHRHRAMSSNTFLPSKAKQQHDDDAVVVATCLTSTMNFSDYNVPNPTWSLDELRLRPHHSVANGSDECTTVERPKSVKTVTKAEMDRVARLSAIDLSAISERRREEIQSDLNGMITCISLVTDISNELSNLTDSNLYNFCHAGRTPLRHDRKLGGGGVDVFRTDEEFVQDGTSFWETMHKKMVKLDGNYYFSVSSFF
uniref:Uncharacterized protein n=1 Tax=Corethron hystrix TaxID=216773 RepID=A0A7S1FUM2_9STRA|mmetsp:Transcript_29832/g.68454  ORF Transcript_29832/g.68454 Transcript_29832/m.68454 type:complete len:209 (+) Transcript_29832:108-734(+)